MINTSSTNKSVSRVPFFVVFWNWHVVFLFDGQAAKDAKDTVAEAQDWNVVSCLAPVLSI